VSIVIPTRNRAALLRACIESILAADTGPVEEIIVVDNASTDPDTLDYLERIDGSAARVLRLGGPFNYSHVNNRAIDIARGQNVCLLNNDIEVVTKDWLIEMMLRLADSEVGAVGALLIWPNGLVQHGGTVVGPQFAATHAFTMISADDPGYGDLLSVAHECSAVTAACLLTRKADYMAVGGLDETLFPVNFNDVDYCLKLRSQGRRIVFTPHVRLIHHESASRGTDATPERADRYRRELRHLRARWRDALLNDPYYSPALALDPMPFSGLAWPPRPCNPRRLAAQTPIEIPSGF
jgi:GT2 family glycosyltransferase